MMEPAAATNNSAVATNGATQAEWHERVMHKCRESVENGYAGFVLT